MRRASSLVVSGVLLIGFLSVAAPATAVQPDKQTFVDQGFFVLPDIDCGSFTLHEELVSELIQVLTYMDAEGTPIRQQVTVNFTGALANLSTGQVFRDTVVGMDTYDLASGEAYFSGPGFKLHRTGEGIVFIESGRKVLDADGNLVMNAGPDDFTQSGFAGLCAALA